MTALHEIVPCNGFVVCLMRYCGFSWLGVAGTSQRQCGDMLTIRHPIHFHIVGTQVGIEHLYIFDVLMTRKPIRDGPSFTKQQNIERPCKNQEIVHMGVYNGCVHQVFTTSVDNVGCNPQRQFQSCLRQLF